MFLECIESSVISAFVIIDIVSGYGELMGVAHSLVLANKFFLFESLEYVYYILPANVHSVHDYYPVYILETAFYGSV